MESVVFHIIGADDWADAKKQTRYVPDRFAQEGFIHLSDRDQILRPANLLYTGRRDLLLLVIDKRRLTEVVRYEPGSHGEDELFPHLYGALNLDAVIDVVGFPCSRDGTFELPPELPGWTDSL